MNVVDDVLRRHPELEEATFVFKCIRKGVLHYQAMTTFKVFDVTLLPHPVVDLHKEECIEKLFQADESAIVRYRLMLGGKDELL